MGGATLCGFGVVFVLRCSKDLARFTPGEGVLTRGDEDCGEGRGGGGALRRCLLCVGVRLPVHGEKEMTSKQDGGSWVCVCIPSAERPFSFTNPSVTKGVGDSTAAGFSLSLLLAGSSSVAATAGGACLCLLSALPVSLLDPSRLSTDCISLWRSPPTDSGAFLTNGDS